MKIFKILFLILLIAFYSCSSDDDSISSNNSQMNECLGAEVPFPTSASINACVSIEQGKSVVFDPNLTWQQSINFFSSQYNSGEWTITSQQIPEETSGERTAEWSIVGSSFDVEISITAFGDSSSGFMVGSYIVYY